MNRCPRCKVELEEDRIGGVGRSASRVVLLCAKCWQVFPVERPARHLALVETRRDLA